MSNYSFFNSSEEIFESINFQIEKIAKLSPSKIAVKIDDELINYNDLISKVNKLSNFLIAQNIPIQSNIVIYMDRSIEYIVAMLAVINTGCIYVPVDPVHSNSRIDYILNDSVPSIIITEKKLTQFLPLSEINVLEYSLNNELIDKYPDSNSFVKIFPEYIMYMIYTSGTTGVPKGVIVNHGGTKNLLDSVKRFWPLDGNVLQFASFGFDASIPEWAGCLSMGGTLVMVRNRKLILGEKLIDLISKFEISIIKMPAAVLNTLDYKDNLPHLQTIVTAGDACNIDLVKKWSKGKSFFNCYGPTETTIGTTISLCQSDKIVTIGKPHKGITVYILDQFMNPVELSEIGEIYIGGKGVSYGYYGNPALTAEKFLPDPFSNNGSRIYKTGDLGRLCENGEIEFIGRVDSQVKIRGYRIELEEINIKVKKNTFIKEANTIVIKNDNSEDILVTFFTEKNGCHININDVKSFLKKELPDYMVPNELYLIEEFHLTSNGKIDSKYLLNYWDNMHSVKAGMIRNDNTQSLELSLKTFWSIILNEQNINTDSDFFDLGGTSLDAAKLIGEIESNLGVSPSIADLYENPKFSDFLSLTERFIKAFAPMN